MPELRNVIASEVSLVDRPAIRKRILLYKSENGGADMPKFSEKATALLAERVNTASPTEDTILAKVEEIRKAAGQPFGEEERDIGLALLRVAGATEQPAEKRAAQVAALMGTPDKVEKVMGKCPKCGEMIDSKDVQKDGHCPKCALSASTVPIAEIVKAEVGKAVADLQKANAEKDKQISELLAKSRKDSAIEKAAKTGALGSRDTLAELIEKAEEAGIGDKLMAVLNANGEAIEKSKLFLELGSSAAPEGSAFAKLEAMARERVAKSSDGKLTFEQALDLVCQDRSNAEIYKQYLAEKGAH